MKRFLAVVFLVGLAAMGAAGLYISRERARETQMAAAEELRKKAFELSSEARPPNLARRSLRLLFPRVRGVPVREAYTRKLLSRLMKGFPEAGYTLFLVDSGENLLWASKPDPRLWEIARERLGGTWLRRFGLEIPTWRYVRPRQRPGTLLYWRSSPNSPPGTVAGAILAIDVMKITRDRILTRAVFREQRPDGSRIGLWDQVGRRGIGIPSAMGERQVEQVIDRFSRREGNWLASQGRILVLHPVDGTKVLFGLVDRQTLAVPSWFWPLFFSWMALFGISWKTADSGKISMKAFLGLALGVSAGLPLFLTMIFWFFFEKNRVASLVGDELQSMEQRLIQIDNQLPELRRQRRRKLRGLTEKLETHVSSMTRVLDEIGLLEMKYETFDIFYLISSQGVHLRDYSMLDPSFRHVAPLPMDRKMPRMQGLMACTEMPPRKAVELAVNMKLTPEFLPEFWSYKPSEEHTRKTREGLGVVGKMMVSRYNQMVGKDAVDEGKGNKSDLVYGAVIDSQTGDLLQVALSMVGDILRLGSGILTCWVYVDVVRDSSGVAQYFVMGFMDMRGPEHAYLERVFAERWRWPPRWYFAAESFFSHTFFPLEEKRHSLRRYFDRLSPPRVLYSKVVARDGRKMLLSAYAARYLNHFVLYARRPWSVIETRQMEIRRQMALIAGLMVLLMMGISWRLYQGIIVPADALMAGVKAMEEKNFAHSIPLLTGDEWDELAGSFNTAIQGMEELEVASVVQSMILPSGVIRGKAGYFLGRSLMTGQVGGDYFDAIAGEDGGINFVIGDVTGHGVSAALVVAMAKSCFQIIHRSGVRSPAEVLTRMNTLMLTHLAKKKSLTMQAGWLTPEGKLFFCNAGHPFPYLLSPGKNLQQISHRGFPLGAVKKARYTDMELELSPPANLLLYTDGLIEQSDDRGNRLGFTGFEAELGKLTASAPETLIPAIHQSLRTYTGGKPWDDDVTLACLHLSPP